eukprot:scaffold3190_cov409-Prasinococcus_capsulatus_cf.AAC.18
MDIHKDDTCGSEDVIDARGMEVEVQCYNLRGSILAWTQQGLPLVDPKGKPTTQVHVFARDWEMLGKGYRAVRAQGEWKALPRGSSACHAFWLLTLSRLAVSFRCGSAPWARCWSICAC